ncbi:GNAT family N-acetyltransferase [Halobacillus sp. K22]|uniref:GNAT family N-acetyltransferase n=1 Tax=Halobacillus sp. K22 TaxID=3457431 RepID=UPI003FCD7DC1
MDQTHRKLSAASLSRIENIYNLYVRCRGDLLESGIQQWNDQYPSRDYFEDCIHQQSLFVLSEKGQIVGHVVLNEWQSEEWKAMAWKGSNPLIMHSLMIDPAWQGKGCGTEIAEWCEDYAISKGYDSIRLDAFSGNQHANNFYQKLGYESTGTVTFSTKPKGHQTYHCYEKSWERR